MVVLGKFILIKIKNKKAQLKIQQMAFMLIAIMIFFVLVGLFALSMSFGGLKEKKEALDEQNALLLISKLANYPEFSCENAYGGDKLYCIDFDKIMVLKNHPEYLKFLDIKNVEIKKITEEEEIICTELNYPNCNYLSLFEGGREGSDKSAFVSLCRKESFGSTSYNKCELARLIVRF
jgi:hypothetical protein